MIVRPVAITDLPALLELARCAGPGVTSLPANEERLAHRVRWAQRTRWARRSSLAGRLVTPGPAQRASSNSAGRSVMATGRTIMMQLLDSVGLEVLVGSDFPRRS